LKKRFTNNENTTERCVSYTFFAALIINNYYQPHEIQLEFPHPKIVGKKVDTYIRSTKDRKGMVLEYKYDRIAPAKRNSPRTQKAGKVFNDLYRLAMFDTDKNVRKWFVYITDTEMASYFSNIKNGVKGFFDLDVNNKLVIDNNYLQRKADTFQKSIDTHNIKELKVTCVCKYDLPNFHKLRIYEIDSVV
jgi:hypothetical protein